MTIGNIPRRRFLTGTAALMALGALPEARAQEKNIRVVIPTRQGGGAERLARVFDDFWGVWRWEGQRLGVVCLRC